MTPATIKRSSLAQIVAQAEREFPDECCGFIIGDMATEEVRPIANIQNQMHAEDPTEFVRDARTAFLMDPKAHLAVMNEAAGQDATAAAFWQQYLTLDSTSGWSEEARRRLAALAGANKNIQ